MQNLKRFAKILLIIVIALLVVNIVMLAYVYMTSTRAMKDTLSNIALVVAEENCISKDKDETAGSTAETKVDSIKKLLASNSTIWLCYNTSWSGHEGENITINQSAEASRRNGGGLIHSGVAPTNLVHASLTEAMNNVSWSLADVNESTYSAVKLSLDGTNTNNSDLYSYLECPQRGQPITINLNAYVTYRFMTLFGTFDFAIPVHEQITVIGMKFYRGR